MHKYAKREKLFKEQVDKDVKDLLSPQFSIDNSHNTNKDQEALSLKEDNTFNKDSS